MQYSRDLLSPSLHRIEQLQKEEVVEWQKVFARQHLHYQKLGALALSFESKAHQTKETMFLYRTARKGTPGPLWPSVAAEY